MGAPPETRLFQEEIQVKDDTSIYGNDSRGARLVQVKKKDSIIGKSLDKLKETCTVTAVGHAAVLAAIQLYVPSLMRIRLFPGRYLPHMDPERLDLLRPLEKVNEMDNVSLNQNAEEYPNRGFI
ncbi:hypothetical protein Pfo_004098 [Paulownia fortunei]|nr:hypothetical protein Pfo_004098 [Paulownia fortunei]